MNGSFFLRLLLTADPRADKQACRLYRKAVRRAKRRLATTQKTAHPPLVIGADEVSVELEKLLRGACSRMNCLEAAAYQRLHQAIVNWRPVFRNPQRLLRCGLVQNELLTLLPECRRKQRLEQLCERYQAHLEKAALAAREAYPHRLTKPSQPSLSLQKAASDVCAQISLPDPLKKSSTSKNDSLIRIQEKQAAVSRMREVWATREDVWAQCQRFQTVFQQERRMLEKDRDSVAMTFLKAVATVLSLGLAAVCGIWSVKGQKTAKKIEQALEAPGPSL